MNVGLEREIAEEDEDEGENEREGEEVLEGEGQKRGEELRDETVVVGEDARQGVGDIPLPDFSAFSRNFSPSSRERSLIAGTKLSVFGGGVQLRIRCALTDPCKASRSKTQLILLGEES